MTVLEYTGAMSDTMVIDPAQATEDDYAAFRDFVAAAKQHGAKVKVIEEAVLLTPIEVAKRLGTSRTTVLRRIADGEIKAVKVGSHNRIPLAEYERYRDELFHAMAVAIGPDIEAELFGE